MQSFNTFNGLQDMENDLILNKLQNHTYGSGFAERLWTESWAYIKMTANTVHEPFLILDKDLCVMWANESFYRVFQEKEKDTENECIYTLGNGQWNIAELKKMLEDILPETNLFKGLEITHYFPVIGRKALILNARRIYREGTHSEIFPPIILLTMEDATDMMDVGQMLARHSKKFEVEIAQRTGKLELHIKDLEQQLQKFHTKK